MKRRFALYCAPAITALGLVLLAAPSRSTTLYQAHLSAAQSTGTVNSTATGFGSVLLNDAMDQITVNENWTGLTAPALASHIHTAALGTNGPITFPFTGVPNATSGSIPEQSFAITPAQLAQLNSGNMYFNIHTSNYPAGEIRGQIGPVVPEPGSLALLLAGAPAGLFMIRRRRSA